VGPNSVPGAEQDVELMQSVQIQTPLAKRAGWSALAMLALLLASCGAWERASVTVTYDVEAATDNRYVADIGKKNVESALKAFSEKNGFKCKPDFKHPDETHCTGPKDLHMEFVPVLNKRAYVATFSWVDSGGRTHEEFERLVTEFSKQMAGAVGDRNVQVQSSPD
jgi:hypothetical protein